MRELELDVTSAQIGSVRSTFLKPATNIEAAFGLLSRYIEATSRGFGGRSTPDNSVIEARVAVLQL